MAIKFEKIKPGMVLYDRHKYTMGNTTLRSLGEWPVRVLEVDGEKRRALVSWNHNRPEWVSERRLSGYSTWSMYDKDAEVTKGFLGNVSRVRRLTKKEMAAKEGGSDG